MQRRARFACRHILLVALWSIFGTLIRSKTSLGCIHARSGMQGTCSTYTFKFGRRKVQLGISLHQQSSVDPPLLSPCSLSGVRSPTLPCPPCRVFGRLSTNRPPSLWQLPQLCQYSPTETHARPSLHTFHLVHQYDWVVDHTIHQCIRCILHRPELGIEVEFAAVGRDEQGECGWTTCQIVGACAKEARPYSDSHAGPCVTSWTFFCMFSVLYLLLRADHVAGSVDPLTPPSTPVEGHGDELILFLTYSCVEFYHTQCMPVCWSLMMYNIPFTMIPDILCDRVA